MPYTGSIGVLGRVIVNEANPVFSTYNTLPLTHSDTTTIVLTYERYREETHVTSQEVLFAKNTRDWRLYPGEAERSSATTYEVT